MARASLADTYGQAVSDIRLSIPMLKTAGATNTPSLVSRTAAQGVLARVFLTMAGPGTGDPATTISLNDPRYYDSTIYYAQQVVNSNEHSLYTAKQGMTFPDSSFAYIFINESRQITNIKECIWEATFSGNDVASQYPVTLQGATGIFAGPPCNATSPTDYGIIGTCFNAVNVPKGVYDLFGNGDLRRDWTICPYYYTTVKAGVTPTQPSDYNRSNYPTQPHEYYVRPQGKWRREFETIVPKSRFSSPESFPILRFSDVLLMLAEAELMSPTGNRSDALEKVNMVRRRGYGFPVNTGNALSDLTALTLNDIVDERTRELAFEGHRWVDLRRWGIYDTKMRALQARMEADGVNTANGSHGNGNQFYGGMTNRTMNFRSGYQYIVNANSSDKFALLPIPLTETSTNQLIVQNPGW
ncbi:RagB/SusD family nutrient uptake outer membrane protein [Niabella hibiscisoli]|uniref:RagB/SusD family nutrient uptake outer membrane protein n=1 Tax=Niabella hibiscisoli TaxID=1825928 RepID=UPI001F0FE11E|nr:RagB/SusD family nutrient uptake outer membrane protein [Niabella hibiscisoli]MCH5718382.1 RagB/SusD family nutrient uptake outer membrane protein [Niabella hibiscisoli]